MLNIFLVTYNRKNKLKQTLDALLAENSPIKNFKITILDNCSTDGSSELIEEYCSRYTNLKHIRRNRNIGGNANIAGAFELAKAKYMWILCDNDNYCWDSWKEVEQAMAENADAIFVSTFNWPDVDIADAFVQSTFVPGVIYKTANIDDNVMENIEYNISNMFPHAVLFGKLINENKDLRYVSKEIVTIGPNEKNAYFRGNDIAALHPFRQASNWHAAYAVTLLFIKNPKLRNYIATHRINSASLNTVHIIRGNSYSLYNLFCIFCALSNFQRIIFILKYIYSHTLFYIIYIRMIYMRDKNMIYRKKLQMCLLYFIKITFKTKLIQRKKIKNNFIKVKNITLKEKGIMNVY